MKAARVHHFGPPDVIVIDDLPCPNPSAGEVLLRVSHAGVGPWDAWIREGRSVVTPALPLTLGSDLAGIVEAIGAGVVTVKPGDAVYGATNPEFIGAYAQFAVANANMLARKPASLSFAEAASAPVVAVTAWQMLFEYGKAKAGQTVLIHGGGGSVGAYAVQLAVQAGLHVIATASAADAPYVQSKGAGVVIDYRASRFEDSGPMVDLVLDTVGGETSERSLRVIKPGGILVSIVTEVKALQSNSRHIKAVFFLVEVTTERLDRITDLFEREKLTPRVGNTLPLDQVRTAHEMLGGAPHQPGKIVLRIGEISDQRMN